MLKGDPTKSPMQKGELNRIIEELRRVRTKLLEIDPEFREFVMKNKRVIKRERAEDIAMHRARRAEGESAALVARTRAEDAKRSAVDEWVQSHRMKMRSSEEVENTIKQGILQKSDLMCPICYDSDRGNIVDGEPMCMKCWHKLVPNSEIEKYNRAYRRKWLRRRKR